MTGLSCGAPSGSEVLRCVQDRFRSTQRGGAHLMHALLYIRCRVELEYSRQYPTEVFSTVLSRFFVESSI